MRRSGFVFVLTFVVLLVGTTPRASQQSPNPSPTDRRAVTDVSKLGPQTCDDKLCYNPVSVPLSWTVAVKPFVTPGPAR